MAWKNLKVLFTTTTLLYLWICSQVSCEVDVNCWWNKALAVGHSVSVLCHMSTLGRANSCGLCQVYVIILDHRHQFPGTCASTKETFNFTIAAEHRESIRCLCNSNTSDTCSVTVRDWPSPPSRPDCVIEDEIEDIYCSWTNPNEEMIPTVYTIHWKDYDGNVKSRESSSESAVIYRREYMTSADITVWVTAKNELGSAESERSVFNTGHIKRPDAPYNINLTSEPLELIWDMDCEGVDYLDKSCQVQYRAHNLILDWTEVDDNQFMFMLENPQPYTQYSFRVRCHCGYVEKVMSDWSSVYSIRTPPAAPVGQLDVWSDCVPNSDKSSCNVYWKEMPLSQARGEIINYIVTMKLKNGTEVKQQVTRQRRDTGSQQLCFRKLRHYLKLGVIGVFVSANTSIGTSDPTYVLFAERGQRVPEVNLSITGDSQALRVSWSIHPEFSESILEYVVQHVSVVPDILCLNWVRVKRSQRSVTLTGDFWNYTAYNVSLFAVSSNHSTFLKSAIAYTLEGVPPKVPQIHVENITHSSATLTWSPIPVNESKGVILHYLVGIKETGSNLSSNRTSMQLSELQPAHQYHIWVSAVSAAGEGDKLLTAFSTSEKNSNATLLTVFIILMPLILFVFGFVLVLVYKPDWCFVKIPDPINSKTFKHMNFQHAWPRHCSPSELNIKISELEILEKPDCDTPTPPLEAEENKAFIDVEPQHFQLPNGLDRTNKGGDEPDEEPEESSRRNILKHDSWAKEYSEMVDTDEEKDGGDEEEWWDQQCVSDYERHFLPSVAAN